MKICLAALALLVATLDRAHAARIPRSLSKAALEATKKTPKLRKLEQKRVRSLTALIREHGGLKSDLLRSELKNNKVRKDVASKERVLRSDHKLGDRHLQQDHELGDRRLQQDHDAEQREQRELANNNYNNYNNNANANNNNANANNNNANANADGDAADNVWGYNWNYDGAYDFNQNLDNEAAGFDMTEYSFHYTGCSAIKTWSDEMAEDEDTDTVLIAQRMATFRLCPTDTCSSSTYNGCSSNYGDYVVGMDQFLLGMLALQENRVMSYCEYCQECADIEAFKSFSAEVEYRRKYVLSTSEAAYEKWVESYKENYAQNGYNNGNYQYNANGNGNANGYNYNYQYQNNNADQAAAEEGDDDAQELYYSQLYYKKLTNSGNYANQYVYGNGAYRYYNNNYNYNNNNNNYNNNNYNNGNNNNYQNQDMYDQSFNMYYSNNGYNGGNNNYYNANNQAYGSNGASGQYSYQTQPDNMDDATWKEYQQTMKNQEKWKMWDSFNMNYNGQNGNGDVQAYQQMMQQMQGWSNMGAWYGHRVVNGRTVYDEYGNASWEKGWGYIGSDGEFYSLEDSQEAIAGTDFSSVIPGGWSDWLGQDADDIESCSYDNAGSCYNQFFSCMQMLGDDEYGDYIEQFNYELYAQMYGDDWAQDMYEDMEKEQFRASMSDYLECTKVELNIPEVDDGQQNNQNQNQYQSQNPNGGGYDYANGQWQVQENFAYQGQWEQYRNADGDIEFYIGPHCDGQKITLGVYLDEYCSNYATNVKIEDLLGFDPMADDDFDLVPTTCVSCLYDEETEKWYDEEEVEGAEDGIEPMCSILYQFSGKCQKNLKPASSAYSNSYLYNQNGNQVEEEWLQMYQSNNQYLNEELVCAYIDSLRLNTYDEQGDIVLDPSISWKPNDWQKELSISRKAMAPGYKAGLVLSAFAMTAMAVCACVLHGLLARKNIPWKTKRITGGDPTDIARQNSGILMGRSRSGPANTPLI